MSWLNSPMRFLIVAFALGVCWCQQQAVLRATAADFLWRQYALRDCLRLRSLLRGASESAAYDIASARRAWLQPCSAVWPTPTGAPRYAWLNRCRLHFGRRRHCRLRLHRRSARSRRARHALRVPRAAAPGGRAGEYFAELVCRWQAGSSRSTRRRGQAAGRALAPAARQPQSRIVSISKAGCSERDIRRRWAMCARPMRQSAPYGEELAGGILPFIQHMRQVVRERFERALPQGQWVGVLSALAIGDQSAVSAAQSGVCSARLAVTHFDVDFRRSRHAFRSADRVARASWLGSCAGLVHALASAESGCCSRRVGGVYLCQCIVRFRRTRHSAPCTDVAGGEALSVSASGVCARALCVV